MRLINVAARLDPRHGLRRFADASAAAFRRPLTIPMRAWIPGGTSGRPEAYGGVCAPLRYVRISERVSVRLHASDHDCPSLAPRDGVRQVLRLLRRRVQHRRRAAPKFSVHRRHWRARRSLMPAKSSRPIRASSTRRRAIPRMPVATIPSASILGTNTSTRPGRWTRAAPARRSDPRRRCGSLAEKKSCRPAVNP